MVNAAIISKITNVREREEAGTNTLPKIRIYLKEFRKKAAK